MPRTPCANSRPFMRLMCAVLSVISRLRSRWERRRSSSSNEPKRVVSRLVAEYDRWLLATHLRPAITGRDELCHQAFAVAAFERIDARLLTIGKLDTQQP